MLTLAALSTAPWAFPEAADQATAATRFALPAPASLARIARQTVQIGIYSTMALIPAPQGKQSLLDLDGHPLGPRVDELQFCDLAARGTAVIEGATYQVVGTAREAQTFCGRYYSRLHRKQPVAAGALGRSRFARVDWKYGLGVGGYRLVPWRTIAAPTGVLGVGRAAYLPALRDLMLPDGSTHDGYVFVADLREAGASAPIDLFVGLEDDAPVASNLIRRVVGERAIPMHVIGDPAIVEPMRSIHTR